MQEDDKKIKEIKKNAQSEKVKEIKKNAEVEEGIKIQKVTKKNHDKDNLGKIIISPEVLATVVSRIVLNTKGVAGLAAHSKGGFGTLLGVKEMEEGIKVDLINENQMTVYISVIIEHGLAIIDVAKNIQSIVKKEIEKNAGLNVKSVDVNVMDIRRSSKKNSKS